MGLRQQQLHFVNHRYDHSQLIPLNNKATGGAIAPLVALSTGVVLPPAEARANELRHNAPGTDDRSVARSQKARVAANPPRTGLTTGLINSAHGIRSLPALCFHPIDAAFHA